jgi:hypothetical protein
MTVGSGIRDQQKSKGASKIGMLGKFLNVPTFTHTF